MSAIPEVVLLVYELTVRSLQILLPL